MGRKLRIQYEGVIYHLINHGKFQSRWAEFWVLRFNYSDGLHDE